MTGQVGSDLVAGAEERQQWIGHDSAAVDLERQIEAFALRTLEEPNRGRRVRCYLRQPGDALNHQQLVDKVRVACHEPGARRQPRQREFRMRVRGAECPQSWNRTQQIASTGSALSTTMPGSEHSASAPAMTSLVARGYAVDTTITQCSDDTHP